MENIKEELQLKESTCIALQTEIYFFDELILDIKMRQVLSEEFEKYLIKSKIDENFPDNNDFCRMILKGYLVQQILDLNKFFDKDNSAYSLSFIIKHGANNLKERRDKLSEIWKNDGLKNVRDKVFAHSQKGFTISLVEKKVLNDFINKTVILFKDVIKDLGKAYSISSTHSIENCNEDYLTEVANDVEGFFNTLSKTENN